MVKGGFAVWLKASFGGILWQDWQDFGDRMSRKDLDLGFRVRDNVKNRFLRFYGRILVRNIGKVYLGFEDQT